MRFLKAALIGLAVVLVIALGAGAYLLSRIDKDTLVREARALVKKETGRTLDIGGKVDLRILFKPAIVVENIRFSNASWGSRPDMVRARRFEIELALIPLITGTIRIDRLVIVAPDVLLETDAKGRANWQFHTKKAAAKPADAEAPSLPAIDLEAFRITDGVFVYRDGARGTQTRVEIKTLDRKSAGFGQSYPLAVKGSVNGRAFELNGTIDNPAAFLKAGATYPFDLKITAEKVQARAKGRLIDVLGRADAQVQVQIEAKDVQDLAGLAGQKIPPLGALKAHAMIDRDKGRLGVRDLDLELGRAGALQVSARGSIRDVMKPAGVSLEVSASVPRSKQAPPFRASGRLEDFKDGVRVADLKIASGKNKMKGDLEYRPGKARPRVAARLDGSGLDLAFLAATGKGLPGPEPKAGGPLFPREPLPLRQLRALDADAQISVGALVLPNGVTLRNVMAKLELTGGKLRVEPVNFLAGGGRTTAVLVVDASRDVPSLSVRLQGRHIIVGDLLDGTANAGKIKGGATDVDVTLATTGSSPHDWAAGLNGNVRIAGGEATARSREINYGSDLLTQVADAINPFRKTDPEIHVQCMAMRVPITDGIVHSDRGIGAETDKMSALSSGTIDLGKEVLDINLRPRAKEGIGLGGARLAQMVRVTGPLADPKLGLDFGGTVGTAASLAAGVATMGLSLLGERLYHSAADENACKVALGSTRSPSTGAAGESGSAGQPAAKEPAAKKEERGFFDRLLGK